MTALPVDSVKTTCTPSQTLRAHLAWTRLTGLPVKQRGNKKAVCRHRNRLREQRMGRGRHAGKGDASDME